MFSEKRIKFSEDRVMLKFTVFVSASSSVAACPSYIFKTPLGLLQLLDVSSFYGKRIVKDHIFLAIQVL